MQRFKVAIHGDGLERAMAALNRASIPTIGPAMTWYGEEPQQVEVSDRMLAVLDADSAKAAEARVRRVLPDGDYLIESASLWQ